MSTEEIKFLRKQELINEELMVSWQRFARITVEQSAEAREVVLVIMYIVMGMGIAAHVLHAYVNPIRTSDWSSQIPTLILYIVYNVFLIYYFRHTGFDKYINKLNALFHQFGYGYCLHHTSDELKKKASHILNELANLLDKEEEESGHCSEEADVRRWAFKDAHQILVRGELCEKDQGKIIPRKKKKVKASVLEVVST